MPQYLRSIPFLWTICLSLTLPGLVSGQGLIVQNTSDCGEWFAINDNDCGNPQLFPINVVNAPGASLGVDVYLEKVNLLVSHEWLADLEIKLVSPSGIKVNLIDEVGSGNQNFGDPTALDCSITTTLVSHIYDVNCGIPLISQTSWPYIDEYLPLGNFSNFHDGSSPIGTWALELCDDAFPDTGSLQYVELIFASANCLQPSDLEEVHVDSNSALINWVSGAVDCSNTIIEYGPIGFTPGSGTLAGQGTIVNVGCPPAVITGLEPSTSYDIYIRQDCGGGSVSANACSIEIATTCSPAPITLLENFDGQNLCTPICGVPCKISGFWTNSLVDNEHFDWIVNADSTGTSGTGPSDDFPGGGQYIYVDYSDAGGCRRGSFASLVSSCLDVVARPDTCDMSFDYHMFGSHVQSLTLQITTDGGANWVDLWSRFGSYGDEWRRAYIDLDVFHGQTVQLRFLGEGGSQKKGDIALDNLTFYGSVPSLNPVFTFFQDGDGDGFGGQEVFYQSCEPFLAAGFVPDSTDCDDDLIFVNPGMPESPCDNFDLNCNPNDETELPVLVIENDTVCSGEIGQLVTFPSQFSGLVSWYLEETDTVPLATGNSFSPPNFPENLTPDPIVLTFFAEEVSSDSCVSIGRTMGQIVILPQAEISTVDNPEICLGEAYDLTTIDVIDAAGANGVISYHGALPIEPSTEINPVVNPTGAETYYIASTPAGGCTDVVSVGFQIKDTPEAFIDGNDFVCFKADSAELTAFDIGSGVAPLDLDWNLNSTSSTVTIFPNAIQGGSDIYTVTITGANGCSDTDTLEVFSINSSLDPVTISSQPVSICQGSDGTISLSPQNGEAPFDYYWEGNGQSGSAIDEPGDYTITGLTQGAYSITIIDNNPESCPFIFPLQPVDGPGAILTDSEVSPVSCNAGIDGCIEINVVGNAPSILWETGDTTEQICGLTAGEYDVTITDGSCQSELTFTVPEPDKLLVSSNVDDVTCNGLSDGRIELNVFNGNGGFQFEWEHGPQTSIINNLTADSYSVTITDSKDCLIEIPFLIVDEPDPIDFQVDILGEPSCFNGTDGQITVTPIGGTPPFDVDWSNGGMGTTVNSLTVGTYGISIDDSNGCLFTDQIILSQPNPIQVLLENLESPECNGIDDGTIEINVSGGNGGYNFEWSNGAIDEDLLQILAPGPYSVTVTDATGCTGVSEPYVLTENPFIEVSLTVDDPTCVGVDDGMICIEVDSGGVTPFQFDWSVPGTGQCRSGLEPGEFTVTVLDGAGCSFDTTINLIANQALTVDWVDESPSCFGMSTGRIELNISDGTQPYQVDWSNGKTGIVIDSLPSGSYGATITDATGCEIITPLIPLKDPSRLVVEALNIEGVTCFGDEDGSVDLDVYGGTPPIQIEWSNSASESSISGLAPGIYQVTATDNNGCVNDSVSVEILSPTFIEMSAEAASLGCTSFSIDTLCLNVQGGISPYEFLWSDGSDMSCLINAPVGDYAVTVTDEIGCTSILESIKVNDEIDVMTLTETLSVDSICAGETIGALEVTVEGGVAPFQFIWSNAVSGLTNDPVFALSDLSGGAYQITITDNFGCTKTSQIIQITEADSMNINTQGFNQTPVSCFDGNDGAIDIEVSGGYLPYSFEWENEMGIQVGTTEDLENLEAGEYTVTVTSGQNCQVITNVTVEQPEEDLGFGPSGVNITNETCFQDGDGVVTVSAGGGTAPYFFVWSTGDTTVGPSIDELVPGEYFVTIVDGNGCEYFSNELEVLGADTSLYLADFQTGDASCFGEEDGFIDINMQGGFGTYTYSWTPSNTNEDLINIGADDYALTVWDENLCQYDTSFEISQPDELILSYTVEDATDGDNGSITCTPFGGQGPYECEIDGLGTGVVFENLAMGWYELTVTDEIECSVSEWVFVDGVSSSGEELMDVNVSVFPNPSSGQVSLVVNSLNSLNFDLNIQDAFGRSVLQKNILASHGIPVPIDLSTVAPGIYFLTGFEESGGILFSEKLILVGNPQP